MNEITRDVLRYKKTGRLLDLGSGEGPIATELSNNGFEITCIDLSKEKLTKIKGPHIKKVCADIATYNLEEEYDVTLLLGILHLLTKKESLRLIKRIQGHTNNGGIHVIDAFTKNITKKELLKQYKGWNIKELEEYNDNERNEMIYLIIQKMDYSLKQGNKKIVT